MWKWKGERKYLSCSTLTLTHFYKLVSVRKDAVDLTYLRVMHTVWLSLASTLLFLHFSCDFLKCCGCSPGGHPLPTVGLSPYPENQFLPLCWCSWDSFGCVIWLRLQLGPLWDLLSPNTRCWKGTLKPPIQVILLTLCLFPALLVLWAFPNC